MSVIKFRANAIEKNNTMLYDASSGTFVRSSSKSYYRIFYFDICSSFPNCYIICVLFTLSIHKIHFSVATCLVGHGTIGQQ